MEKAQAGKRRIVRWHDGGGSHCRPAPAGVPLAAIAPDACTVPGNGSLLPRPRAQMMAVAANG
jgi:hypothetical protein